MEEGGELVGGHGLSEVCAEGVEVDLIVVRVAVGVVVALVVVVGVVEPHEGSDPGIALRVFHRQDIALCDVREREEMAFDVQARDFVGVEFEHWGWEWCQCILLMPKKKTKKRKKKMGKMGAGCD